MNEATMGYVLDKSMYYEGRVGTMTRRLRKWRDRPAIEEGEQITILRLAFDADHFPRTLVRYASGERWIDPADAEWHGDDLEINGI